MTPWPRLWSKENNFHRGELPDPSTEILAQTKRGFPSFIPLDSRKELKGATLTPQCKEWPFNLKPSSKTGQQGWQGRG